MNNSEMYAYLSALQAISEDSTKISNRIPIPILSGNDTRIHTETCPPFPPKEGVPIPNINLHNLSEKNPLLTSIIIEQFCDMIKEAKEQKRHQEEERQRLAEDKVQGFPGSVLPVENIIYLQNLSAKKPSPTILAEPFCNMMKEAKEHMMKEAKEQKRQQKEETQILAENLKQVIDLMHVLQLHAGPTEVVSASINSSTKSLHELNVMACKILEEIKKNSELPLQLSMLDVINQIIRRHSAFGKVKTCSTFSPE